MPVLSLDQDVLNKLNICSIAEEVSDYVTEEDNLPWTKRKSKYSLMLSSYSYQILHWWVRTSLSYCPQKLSSLRETNSIVAILQLRIIRHHLAHFAHLPVGVSEEPALCINNYVAANHDPVNIDTFNIVLQDRLKMKSNSLVRENVTKPQCQSSLQHCPPYHATEPQVQVLPYFPLVVTL